MTMTITMMITMMTMMTMAMTTMMIMTMTLTMISWKKRQKRGIGRRQTVCLTVGCLTSQQHASVSEGRAVKLR